MKVVILYRPFSEHGRKVEQFVHEFRARNANERLELVDVEGRNGYATATLYDILDYPAIMVVQDDGTAQKIWTGNELPLVGEVASYARV